MLVWPTASAGTIGGGSLERQGLDQAASCCPATRRHALQDYPLGPLLGQCCGGHVRLLVERVDAESLDWLEPAAAARTSFALTAKFEAGAMRRLVGGPGPHGSDSPRTPIAEVRCLSETIRPALPRLVIFGAGHVAQAVARAFAPLPFHLDWLASREDLRPQDLEIGASGTRATILSEDELADAVAAAPAGTMVAIFTHSQRLQLPAGRPRLRRPDEARAPRDAFRAAASRRRPGRRRRPAPDRHRRAESEPAVIAVALAARLLKLTEDAPHDGGVSPGELYGVRWRI